jgi:hypothetical protein
VARKIGTVEAAADFFRLISAGAGKDLDSYLELIPRNPPLPGAELSRA